MLLSNLGNMIHSVYVFHLPVGPVWVLHTFYLVTTALTLFWYVRHTPSVRGAPLRMRTIAHSPDLGELRNSPEAPAAPAGGQ